MKAYIGIDAGKINIKTVVINEKGDIIYQIIIPNNKLIDNIKYIFKNIKEALEIKYKIYNIGITGENRFIIGKFLSTEIIRNEIECIKEYSFFKKIEGNILEISSDNYKILNIKNNKLLDYKIYKSSNLITGNYIYKISQLLKQNIKNIKPTKANISFKNDNLLLLYDEIKSLSSRKNKNIILSSLIKKMLDNLPSYDYTISNTDYISSDNNSCYALALGASLIAKKIKSNRIYDLDVRNNTVERKIELCNKCLMNCEIVSIYRNNELIDSFGNKCDKGKKEEYKEFTICK